MRARSTSRKRGVDNEAANDLRSRGSETGIRSCRNKDKQSGRKLGPRKDPSLVNLSFLPSFSFW